MDNARIILFNKKRKLKQHAIKFTDNKIPRNIKQG